LEKNADFLKKTEQAIQNLIYIIKNIELSPDFMEYYPLVQQYNQLRTENKIWLYKLIYPVVFPIVKFLLKSNVVNLKLFDFFRILYFVHMYDKI